MGSALKARCPDRRFVILERRQAIGGTWDLFRYPGVRSDSDMHTLGYRFKPWTAAKSIADGPSIMAYLRATNEVKTYLPTVAAELACAGLTSTGSVARRETRRR